MTTARTSDLWWKNAVVYCLDVETFLDWDGDGIGDLRGLTERIDYLAGIGVSCIWLMPFQPSPNRDDGYDITDYYGVDPRLGSLGDFVALVRSAKDRGIRVIVDLVVNHTSDQHPWFREARSSPDSRFRHFYVWRDRPTRSPKASIAFPDAEDSIWTRDDKAEQWYLHHFYSHQPDLNIGNQQVRDEIAEDRRVLARAGRRRLPRRRRPVPHRHEPGRRRRSRSPRDPPAAALVHLPPARRRDAPG
jgi:glycosidase